jgi:hypothetical protein
LEKNFSKAEIIDFKYKNIISSSKNLLKIDISNLTLEELYNEIKD